MSTEWITQQNAENQRAVAEEDARHQEAIKLGFQVAKESPEVFQRFINELKANTDALPNLAGEELSGSTSPLGTTSCQVNVTWHNLQRGPNILSWNFHYAAQGIRAVVLGHPRELLFPFRVDHEGRVGIEYGNTVVTPEKMAELTVRKMRELARATR